jgi:UDP-N-acetylmuramate--alanine ligase
LISDYGHHPTAVQQTIQAVKDFYPTKRIILAFQPHEHTRTKVLLKNYINAFDQADVVIFEEIYTVPGRESKAEIEMINSQDVVKKIKKHNPKLNIQYVQDNQSVIEQIKSNLSKNDVVIIMGAGTIYNAIKAL